MQSRIFANFDEYASALGHPSLRLTVLGPGVQPWAMGSCLVDGVRIRRARDGAPCLVEATIEETGIALMTVDTPGKVSGNGVPLGLSSVMIIPGFAGVRAVSLDTIEWNSVFIPASRLIPPGVEEARRLPTRLAVTQGGGVFRDILSRVVAAAMDGAFKSNPLAQREAARQLIVAARELLWPPLQTGAVIPHPAGRHLIPRRKILNRIHEALENSSDGLFSLDDLAKTAGISIRTLHNAFIEQTGVSPKRFVRLRLLNTARRELLRAEPGRTRVVDIAAGLGIWEWGRFARDYRALFGELPSETLRRNS